MQESGPVYLLPTGALYSALPANAHVMQHSASRAHNCNYAMKHATIRHAVMLPVKSAIVPNPWPPAPMPFVSHRTCITYSTPVLV